MDALPWVGVGAGKHGHLFEGKTCQIVGQQRQYNMGKGLIRNMFYYLGTGEQGIVFLGWASISIDL